MKDGSAERTSRASSLAEDLRGLVGRFKRRLREQATAGDLTPSQVAVLARLDRGGPATTSSLARAEAMRPQSMGVVIAGLEALGLVEGSADPADGRRTILSLTDRCRTLLRDGREARQDWLRRTIEARLSPADQDDLARAVALLRRLVDD